LKVVERLQNIYITTSHDTVYRDSVIVREVEIDKTDYAKLDQLNQNIGKLKVYGYLGYILAGVFAVWVLFKELRQKRQRTV
jgi:membrane-associated HD superfamily phosphohydrolase